MRKGTIDTLIQGQHGCSAGHVGHGPTPNQCLPGCRKIAERDMCTVPHRPQVSCPALSSQRIRLLIENSLLYSLAVVESEDHDPYNNDREILMRNQ